MPQMNKGGKFIFGFSSVNVNSVIHLPPMAVNEYRIAKEGKVIIVTGSKTTGGFVVTRKGLLTGSKIGDILIENPELNDYIIEEGKFIHYKGRGYCWCAISKDGTLRLSQEMMDTLELKKGLKLLSIRSSDIAFTMGVRGPLLDKAHEYRGKIQVF
ncbi:MAG: hypothetical protein RSC93_11545 [Erysipelotrichaceae bacterium]